MYKTNWAPSCESGVNYIVDHVPNFKQYTVVEQIGVNHMLFKIVQ